MRTADRLARVQPSATLAITSRAKAMKAEGIDVIGFGAGEPDFNTPEPIINAAKAALDDGLTKYTAVAGFPALRKAIAADYQARYGLETTANQVMVSVGGKHVLYNIAMSLLDEGDKVLIPSPFWVSYPAQVLLAGGEPVFIETREEDGFTLTAEALDAALTEHAPRMLILNSPSNPTGGAYPREALASLLSVLEKHPETLIVWDAIYDRLTYDGFEHVEPAQIAPQLRDRIIVVNGFSKTFAMTGWRLGYGIADAGLVKAMSKLQGHATSGAATFIQAAAIAALELEDSVIDGMVEIFDGRRQRILELLRAIPGVTCAAPRGAFYVFPNLSAFIGKKAGGLPIEDDQALAAHLLETAKVAIVPGSAFGAPGYARLSYATSMEAIETGVKRLHEALVALG